MCVGSSSLTASLIGDPARRLSWKRSATSAIQFEAAHAVGRHAGSALDGNLLRDGRAVYAPSRQVLDLAGQLAPALQNGR